VDNDHRPHECPWDKSKTYPGLCQFIAETRPGYNKEEIDERIHLDFRPYITIIEEPALAISSTVIRSRIKTNQPIDAMDQKRLWNIFIDQVCTLETNLKNNHNLYWKVLVDFVQPKYSGSFGSRV
jgi:hypothetical protein